MSKDSAPSAHFVDGILLIVLPKVLDLEGSQLVNREPQEVALKPVLFVRPRRREMEMEKGSVIRRGVSSQELVAISRVLPGT